MTRPGNASTKNKGMILPQVTEFTTINKWHPTKAKPMLHTLPIPISMELGNMGY